MQIGVEVIVLSLGLAGGFLATVVTTVWKMSGLASKIDKSEKTAAAAHDRLDKYVIKYETAIDELKQQNLKILQTQSRIEAKVSLLIDGKKLN